MKSMKKIESNMGKIIISAVIILFFVGMVISYLFPPDANRNDRIDDKSLVPDPNTNEEVIAEVDEIDDKSNVSSEVYDGDYSSGEWLRQQGKNFAAITHYNRAIEKNPEHVDSYYGRGMANKGIGEYDAAMSDFDTVIRLTPDHVDAYIGRGWTKYLGNISSGVLDFDKAIDINPESAESYFVRGFVKYRMKKYLAAMSDFDKVIDLRGIRGYYAQAYYYRGLCRQHIVYENRHNSVLNLEAKEDWQTALEIAKRNSNASLQNDIEECLRGGWENK